MNLDAALVTFVEESAELLRDLEDGLLAAERGAVDQETLSSIFRAAHTIKGSAGLFGLDAIVAFTHEMESVLDRVRSGGLSLGPGLVAVLLDCKDHLGKLISGVLPGSEGLSPELATNAGGLLAALGAAAGGVSVPAGSSNAGKSAGAESAAVSRTWHIKVLFGADVLRDGMDPLAILRYLGGFGQLQSVAVLGDRIPDDDSFDPETCYLGFSINLHGAVTREQIDSAFSFVRECSELQINEPELAPPEAETPKLIVATAANSPAREPRSQENHSLRIDARKLERLIDLIGELVLTGANVSLGAQKAGSPALGESAERLSRLVEEVRDSALKLRMVQVGATFSRFERVVRDVSRELGKDIRLQIEGGETELDKAIVEQMVDPLTHLVRNAIDHGIEKAEARTARGKPLQGTLRLSAKHEAGVVMIEVSDDGAGLDRARILAKAREQGLVAPDAELPDRDVFSLIFEPGFSTAGAVTNLSGRGVGMDVVKRNVTALRGSIEVHSVPGEGATMRIRLPLTCAIIAGFLVGVGRSRFVLPVDMVEECIEVPAVEALNDEHLAGLELRGQHLPAISLREFFGLRGPQSRRQSIVVLRVAERRVGFVVDELLGEHQTVIKPLSRAMGVAPGVIGSTILADGSIALIVDVATVVADRINQARRAA